MAESAPIETKVTVSTVGALVAAVGIALLNAVLANNTLLGPLPPIVQGLIIAAIPPLIVFASGYLAPHTDRVAYVEIDSLPPADETGQEY